jgi:hypothetical protein
MVVDRRQSYTVGTWTNGGKHGEEDVARIRRGFEALPAIADELGTTNLWLVTNTDRDIGRMDTIREAIGEDRARQLDRGDPAPVGHYTLRHSSAKTLHNDHVGGAILAVFPDAKTLDAIDSLYTRTSVVVVEHMDDAKKWKKKWKPVDLLNNE